MANKDVYIGTWQCRYFVSSCREFLFQLLLINTNIRLVTLYILQELAEIMMSTNRCALRRPN